MDDSDRTLSDLLGLLKSWVPWRSEPAHVSRDFWMPDQSCTVCYSCDSQFTLFNRRHHCRLCGRIFCAKCTSNRVPVPSAEPISPQEECDKIRACDYCFKQWKQGLSAPVENEVQDAHLDLSSTSPSATSFISTKSSGTCGSSNITFISPPTSAGLTPYHSAIMDPSIAQSLDHDLDIGGQNLSQNQFGIFANRTDDDDEEYGDSHISSRTSSFSKANGYFSHVPFDDIDNDFESHKIHPDGDAADSKSMNSSSPQNSFDSQTPGEVQQLVQKDGEHHICDECEAPSSIYSAGNVNAEPVDFENDGLLWLPPEPEDEEDERETLLFEDDDDEDAIGEWGSLRNSSSFGSGEFRNREKSNDEHKRVMKNVVDGHFRALVAQLLQVENIPAGEENDKEGWLEIITALSWEAATLLKPDMSTGGQMDPGAYVKVKCLASGCKSESLVVKGVICKKNVAHRRMTSKIEKPRLMILGGALEYQRISNALSSFDTLLQQEMDHLKMAVAKIESHHPNILLVEKSVSRHAQEYLLEKDISLVLNIKRPLLERIARCTGSQIAPSIDHLSSQKLGYCDMFHVEKFSEEHGTAGQAGKSLVKTLMYFKGCPKPLGCTILLRGANGDELKKLKHVVQYGVFAAYHLALETSFLADEGASLPELSLNSLITVTPPDKSSMIGRSISTIAGLTIPNNEKTPGPQSVDEPQRSNTLATTDLINEAIASIQGGVYSVTSNLPAPTSSEYTELCASSSPEGFEYSSLNDLSPCPESEEGGHVDLPMSSGATTFEAGRLDTAGDLDISNGFGDSKVQIMQNNSCEIDSDKIDSTLPSLQLDVTQTLEEQSGALDEGFPPSPSHHQSILVSLSSRCVWKGTVCERSHLFRIKYYGYCDKPLGRFLRDDLFDQNSRCRSCDMPTEAHIQCYTHLQGSLTISVKKMPEIILPGEKDGKIWMWHRCLRCPRANGFPPATQRVVMSDAAWGLSFGKFLELSFSNHAAASRVASCGHSLHRDCLRFYGFREMVACFRYASIDIHSVYLPPPQLDFSYENQEFMERELNEVAGRAELMFSEVLNALRLLVERKAGSALLNSGIKVPESRHHLADLEKTLQKEKSEFEESLQKILNKDAKEGHPAMDILELNRLRRQLVFQSYMWDHRLIYANSLDYKIQPDDAKVTCTESIQEPVAAIEKLVDINVPVKTGETLDCSNSSSRDATPDRSPEHGASTRHPEICRQRTDADLNSDSGNQNLATDESDTLECERTISRVPSDEEAHISISETLDAAWTGKNHPGVGISKNNVNLSESTEGDKLSNFNGVSEKFYVEDHMEELKVMSQSPSLISPKSSDDTENTVSWLGMSFLSFYRSLNKNFLGSAQKLGNLAEYDPVYVSLFRDSELQGGARLLLPVGVNNTVIPVYDDEPTSAVSYALVSPDYLVQLSGEPERHKETAADSVASQSVDAAHFQSFHSLDEMVLESYKSLESGDDMPTLPATTTRNSLPLDPLSYTKASHARVSFENDGPLGKVKYTVTCYYAKRFEALRRICCPSETDFVRSLSRCKKWGAQGGKSNVFFAKTYDERFIIKQVTKTELESFVKFAPGYFKYLYDSIDSGSPTCLAKILGIYQVTSKHLRGGKESKMVMLVMENLLYGRTVTRLYDLKGSTRSRYNPDSSGSNKVLLDQNLIEAMPTSPIFVGQKAKKMLERAVWNDTSFLDSVDVMDYSLLVGVDEEKHELVIGIIDFMRQYTWDKHLETWVKASGILGGPKNAPPTIISPQQYKRRFRKAMTAYFLMVPDQWMPPPTIPSPSPSPISDLCEESNTHSPTSAE